MLRGRDPSVRYGRLVAQKFGGFSIPKLSSQTAGQEGDRPVLRNNSFRALRDLLFQAVFMVQSAENRFRAYTLAFWQLVPMDTGRNFGLDRFRNSRS